MKPERVICLFLLALLFVPPTPAAAQPTVDTYLNPLDVRVADPFVLKDGPNYYLYGTTSGSKDGFEVFVSDDLVNWRRRGYCYEKPPDSWGDTHFWAPEAVRKGDVYYLLYCTLNRKIGRRNIGLAASSSPLGPFVDVKTPFFDESYSFIDPHLYHDPFSGRDYLYVTQEDKIPSKILGVRLSPSLLEAETSLVECLAPSQKWEDNWAEGAFVLQHKGWYYMMYSGSAWNEAAYAVGYAVASHPLGPWKKHDANPILRRTRTVHGPGHNSAVVSPDGRELFNIYHRHASPYTVLRELAIDRIAFVPDKRGEDLPPLLTMPNTPSDTPQPLPSGAAPRRLARSDDFQTSALDFSRWTIYNENPSNWKLEDGALVIAAEEGDVHVQRSDGRNLFLQYAPKGDYSISTKVRADPKNNHEHAFLVLWHDSDNYVKLATIFSGGQKIETGWEAEGKYDSFLDPNALGAELYLKIRKQGRHCRFFVSPDGENWSETGMACELEREPRKVGLGAWRPASAGPFEARFEFFEIGK